MTVPVIDSHVSWVYTEDLERAVAFYGEKLGLECVRDEGSARLFQVTPTSLIGVCVAFEDRIVSPKGSMISIVTDDVDSWYQLLADTDARIQAPPHRLDAFNIYTFFVEDPDGYVIEFQQFLD